jgi:hypothetical protein
MIFKKKIFISKLLIRVKNPNYTVRDKIKTIWYGFDLRVFSGKDAKGRSLNGCMTKWLKTKKMGQNLRKYFNS